VQVTITGYPIVEGSNATMVLDFNDLKQVMDSVIKCKFDHALIVSDAHYRGQAEEELLGWAEKWKMHYHIFPGRVTAENMATVIQRDISRKLSTFKNIVGVGVRIWETPTSFAEV
jgi:6-pyruvoyl-tetrahydropterin synthase